jgi:hypothetical protein
MRGRLLIRIALVGLVAVLASLTPARACQACFGANVDSPLVDGAKLGVFFLLGVTLSVQGGFVAFFLHLRRRAKRLQAAELASEWADLQRSLPTS